MKLETFKKAETVVKRIESLKRMIELLEELNQRDDTPYKMMISFYSGEAADNTYRKEYEIHGPINDRIVEDFPAGKRELKDFLAALLEDYKIRLDEAEKQLAQI